MICEEALLSLQVHTEYIFKIEKSNYSLKIKKDYENKNLSLIRNITGIEFEVSESSADLYKT